MNESMGDMGNMNDMGGMHDMSGMGGMEGMHDMGGMDMSAMLGPVVFGDVHLGVLLMLVSGIFYFLCALSLIKPYLEEKNELIGALLAFFSYQTISMIFMGVEMHTMNMLYSNIAALAIFIGSAYMLKFPIASLPEKTRKYTFMGVMIASIALFVWFMGSPAKQMQLMSFVLWYDLIINGLIVGGSIIWFGFQAIERSTKLKALGGGTGVVSCCVAANAAMLGGSLLASAIFQFLAPLFILGAISKARKGGSLGSNKPTDTSGTTYAPTSI